MTPPSAFTRVPSLTGSFPCARSCPHARPLGIQEPASGFPGAEGLRRLQAVHSNHLAQRKRVKALPWLECSHFPHHSPPLFQPASVRLRCSEVAQTSNHYACKVRRNDIKTHIGLLRLPLSASGIRRWCSHPSPPWRGRVGDGWLSPKKISPNVYLLTIYIPDVGKWALDEVLINFSTCTD